jgi:hypothetical protein
LEHWSFGKQIASEGGRELQPNGKGEREHSSPLYVPVIFNML